MATAPDSTPGPSPGRAKEWSIPKGLGAAWRQITAGAILAALIGVVFVSSLTPRLRVCEQHSSDPTDSVCRPLGILDPPIILTVLLAMGLVLPDVKRFKLSPSEVDVETRDPAKTLPPSADIGGALDDMSRKIDQLVERPSDGGGDE